ncbi:PEP-CTERM sorting domain-containing protein [Roseateles agri]|uniref:PEP-CTERM sorting domain-containing protein n=1 Tax=Roseateles agri TaxID=3098619 RepID=UPI003D66C4C8
MGTVGLSAQAQEIRYDFTALSSFEIGDPPLSYTGSFSITLPGVPTGWPHYDASQTSGCSVQPSVGPATSCAFVEFTQTTVPALHDTIFFGVDPSRSLAYYFPSGAFSTPGTYDTVEFGASQAGRLVVTAVPEPATWLAMLLGLCVVGGLAVHRRRLRS